MKDEVRFIYLNLLYAPSIIASNVKHCIVVKAREIPQNSPGYQWYVVDNQFYRFPGDLNLGTMQDFIDNMRGDTV